MLQASGQLGGESAAARHAQDVILNAVPEHGLVVMVEMTGEDGPDRILLEHVVHGVPSAGGILPYGLVHQHEDVGCLSARQVVAQPLELGVAEAGGGLQALLGVQADEVRVGVVEGVVKGAEALLVDVLAAPVVGIARAGDDVVVAGQGEEGRLQPAQYFLDTGDVPFPLAHVARIARDQIADVQDDVRLQQIYLLDSLLQHGQPGVEARRAVAEDGRGEAPGAGRHNQVHAGIRPGVDLSACHLSE